MEEVENFPQSMNFFNSSGVALVHYSPPGLSKVLAHGSLIKNCRINEKELTNIIGVNKLFPR